VAERCGGATVRSIRDEVLHIRDLCNKLLDRMAKDEPALPGIQPPVKPPRKPSLSPWEIELMETIRAEGRRNSPGILYAEPYPVGEVFSLHRLQKSGLAIAKLRELISWSWTQNYWRGRIVDASCLLRDLSRLSADYQREQQSKRPEFLGATVSEEVLRDGSKW
jgi:hypothetical protein